LVGADYKLAAYMQVGNEASCQYVPVDVQSEFIKASTSSVKPEATF